MLCGISSRFQLLSPSERQVAHTLLTRPPLSQRKLRRISAFSASFDLHVLGTPPAFILSQDQTLNKLYLKTACAALKSIDAFHSSQKNLYSHFWLKSPSFLVLICISFFLHCSIFKVHFNSLGLSATACLYYHRSSSLSRVFLSFFQTLFLLSISCVPLSRALG